MVGFFAPGIGIIISLLWFYRFLGLIAFYSVLIVLLLLFNMNILTKECCKYIFRSGISSVRLFCEKTGVKPDFAKLVKSNKVVVFMKGVPDEPRCGFSNAVVQILRMHGVPYDAHNVLDDENVRNGIKEYSNWPTIPQVFINGEFVGGCDILLQLHKSGDLIEELKKVGITSALLDEPASKEKK